MMSWSVNISNAFFSKDISLSEVLLRTQQQSEEVLRTTRTLKMRRGIKNKQNLQESWGSKAFGKVDSEGG